MRSCIALSCALVALGSLMSSTKIIRDALGCLEELIEIASRDGDLLRLTDFNERLSWARNACVDIDDSPDGPRRCNQWQEVPFVGYSNNHDVIGDVLKRFENG